MTETSTIGGEHLQRPCHGIESSEGGGFQWVQAAPGDSLQPEATGAGIEISGHRRGHRITPGPAGLSSPRCFNSLDAPRDRFAVDSPLEGAGFELLLPQINSPVLAPDATAGISLMFVFDAHLA